MKSMTRHQLAFVSYDPFTDQRIDPLDGSDLHKRPELPRCAHDAVARAKKLVNKLSSADIRSQAGELAALLEQGQFCIGRKLEQQNERNYVFSDEPDLLSAYLTNADHDIPPERWPELFGILTLSLAGELVNLLWPSDAYLNLCPPQLESAPGHIDLNESSETVEKRVLAIAIEALRSSGFGEGFQAALFELESKRKNRERGKKSHKGKEPLFDAYIKWATDLGKDHPYRYQSHAEEDFINSLKSDQPDLYKLVSATTAETMRKRLKKYCLDSRIPYPFRERSQK
tara:strand:- start:3891 stop:4745 length:855 start_codon:yes stop_codon:yes gene_type:complete